MNKNFGKIIGVVVLVLVLIGGSTGLYLKTEANKHESQLEASKESILNAAANHTKPSKQKVNGTLVYNYLPKNITVPQNAVKMAKSEKAKSFVVVTATKNSQHGDAVNYKITAQSYQKDDYSYKKSGSAKMDNQLVNAKTNQPLALSELLNKKGNLSDLSLQLQNEILKQHKNLDIAKILRLTEAKKLAKIKFNYSNDSLQVTFPANELNVSTVSLTGKELIHVIDPVFYSDKLKAQVVPESKNKKLVAITFDDGPDPANTPKILKTLAKNKVNATFFMVGYRVKENPQIAKQVLDAGNEIGSHTYNHADLVTLKDDKVQSEVESTSAEIYKATGMLPQIVRPPYGAVNKAVAAKMNMPVIQWAIDSRDWETKNSARTVSTITQSTYPGTIILTHDSQPTTVVALDSIIKNLKAKGYEFTTISKMFGDSLHANYQYFGEDDERIIK